MLTNRTTELARLVLPAGHNVQAVWPPTEYLLTERQDRTQGNHMEAKKTERKKTLT
jgi:hypothetical protein